MSHVRIRGRALIEVGRTFTTRELAFPCSYARNAVPTRGKWDTLETKSGESSSGRDGELDLDVIDSAGVVWNAAQEGEGECVRA